MRFNSTLISSFDHLLFAIYDSNVTSLCSYISSDFPIIILFDSSLVFTFPFYFLFPIFDDYYLISYFIFDLSFMGAFVSYSIIDSFLRVSVFLLLSISLFLRWTFMFVCKCEIKFVHISCLVGWVLPLGLIYLRWQFSFVCFLCLIHFDFVFIMRCQIQP